MSNHAQRYCYIFMITMIQFQYATSQTDKFVSASDESIPANDFNEEGVAANDLQMPQNDMVEVGLTPNYAPPLYPLPGYPMPGYPMPGYPNPGYPMPGYPNPGTGLITGILGLLEQSASPQMGDLMADGDAPDSKTIPTLMTRSLDGNNGGGVHHLHKHTRICGTPCGTSNCNHIVNMPEYEIMMQEQRKHGTKQAYIVCAPNMHNEGSQIPDGSSQFDNILYGTNPQIYKMNELISSNQDSRSLPKLSLLRSTTKTLNQNNEAIPIDPTLNSNNIKAADGYSMPMVSHYVSGPTWVRRRRQRVWGVRPLQPRRPIFPL